MFIQSDYVRTAITGVFVSNTAVHFSIPDSSIGFYGKNNKIIGGNENVLFLESGDVCCLTNSLLTSPGVDSSLIVNRCFFYTSCN